MIAWGVSVILKEEHYPPAISRLHAMRHLLVCNLLIAQHPRNCNRLREMWQRDERV